MLEVSHVFCLFPERRRTFARTSLKTCSMVRPGLRMALRSSCVYKPFLPEPSEATEPGAVAYAMNDPRARFISIKPCSPSDLFKAGKGLFRQASRITMFMRELER